MKLKFKSITNLIAKFTPLALFAALGLALAAPQTAQGDQWFRFTITERMPDTGSSAVLPNMLELTEFALVDASGSVVSRGLTRDDAGPGGGKFKYAGPAANSNNELPENLFVSGTSTYCAKNVNGTVLTGSSQPVFIIHLDSSAATVFGYNLRSGGAVNSFRGRAPVAWTVETSTDGTSWGTPIVQRADGNTALTTVRTWYKGGDNGSDPTDYYQLSSVTPVSSLTVTFDPASPATYTGSSVEPKITVANGTTTIVDNKTAAQITAGSYGFTAAWSGTVKNAGSYTLTLTGNGTTYSGTKTATYTVNKKQVPLPPSSISSNVKIGTDGKPTTTDAWEALNATNPTYYNRWYNTFPYYIRQGSACQGSEPKQYYYPKFVLNSTLVDNIEWEGGSTGEKQVTWEIVETRKTVTLDDNGGSGGQGTVKIQVGKVVPALDKVPTKADSTFMGYFDATTGGKQYYNANKTRCNDEPFPSDVTTLYAQWKSDGPTPGEEGQWFRLIIKDVKDPTQGLIQLDELALYDASFNRVNTNLVEGSSAEGLGFGECAYSGFGTAVADAPVGNLFDGNLDRNHMWAREEVSFMEGNYPTITMHLWSDAAPVTYYNFASGGETANRSGCCAPVSWRLERSTDGVNWELFHEQTDVEPVEENDTWLVEGGTENPPQYVIRGDGKVVEWKKPPRQFFRLTILKASNGNGGVKTVGPMKIGKIAFFDAQGNYVIPPDDEDPSIVVGGEVKIGTVSTLYDLKKAIGKPVLMATSGSSGAENLPRIKSTYHNTEWHYDGTGPLSDYHWYIVTTNESPLAAYDIRTSDEVSGNKSVAVLAWRLETSATGEDDDWQFFDERDFTSDTVKPFADRMWYGMGTTGDYPNLDPGKAFRPSFLSQVASSPLRTTESDPLATGGDIILKDGGDYIHVFTNATASAQFTVTSGSILEILAVGAGGAGFVGGGNAGGMAEKSHFAVGQNSTYTITVGAGSSGNGGASTIAMTSGVALSLTANGGTAGGSDGAGGNNGAGEGGAPASGNVGGKGGAGILNAILGWDVTFAGGGGGAGSAGCGAGGLGGGGSQASSDYRSINGEPGLGGGGGGATSGTAGVGGSGLVVIRVKDATGLSSVTLTKTFETWGNDGWNEFPTEEVLDGSGAVLTKGVDYTATWTNSVGSTVLAPDNVGVYTLTVTAILGSGRTGTLTATYTVNTRYITFKSRSVVTLYTGDPQEFPDEECLADIADLAFLTTGYHRNTEVGVYDRNTGYPKFGPSYKINVSPNNGRVAWASTAGPDATEWMTWEIKPAEIVIHLDKNGGSTDPNPREVTVQTGVTLPQLQPTQINLTRDHYTFAGYGDMWDGSGTTYYNANGISSMKYPAKGGKTQLFALWTAHDYQVALMDGTTVLTNVNAHFDEYMPDVEVPSKEGWTFEGYFKNQDGTGDQYYNNKGTGILKYTDTSVTTLYAKWTRNIIPVQRPTKGASGLGVYDRTNKKPNIDTNPGYTITYSNSGSWVDAGSYTATITLNSGYEWDSAPTGETLTFNYTISTKSLMVTGVTVSDREYDGTRVATLNTAGKALDGVCSGDDVQIDSMPTTGTFLDFIGGIDSTPNVGDKLVLLDIRSVTLKGTRAGNYFVNQYEPLRMKVTARVLTLTWGEKSFTYDGNSHCPTCTLGNFVSGEGVGSTPTVTGAATAAGEHTAAVADWNFAGTGMKSNYALPESRSTTFTITAKALTGAMVTLSASSFVYNGANQKPTVTVKDGGETLVKDTDYTLTNNGGTDVGGDYKVIVAGKGNYSGTITKTFAITKATITAVTLASASAEWTGQAITPTVSSVKASGTQFSDATVGWSVTYKQGGTPVSEIIDIGEYTVVVSGINNLKDSAETAFTVTKPSSYLLSAIKLDGPKVAVDTEWLESAFGQDQTFDHYQTEFLSTNPNGVSAWAAYILGFEGAAVPTAALIEKTTQSAMSGGKVTLTVALTDMPTTRTVDGCEVKYSLLSSDNASQLKSGNGSVVDGCEKLATPSFEVPAPTGNHAYYRIRVHFSFSDQAN